MGHFARLLLVGRVTYYVGWIALVCGGLVHLNIARSLFLMINMTQRNLFEVSVVCFLICIASELRALVPAQNVTSGVVREQAHAAIS
jgi:hypothetical protein